ncbi:MAG: hypothetical protein ABI042_04735 [Verrucomicrobiota bacterium]
MGYDVHITRRKFWPDEGDEIAFNEFVQLVRGDKDFKYPGENGDDYADWHSPQSAYESWLSWSDGQIYTKNPEPEFVDKLVEMARKLRARVQGDDGEVYLSAKEIQKEETPPDTLTLHNAPRLSVFFQWPLWKQLVAAFLLGCVLLGLKLLIFK